MCLAELGSLVPDNSPLAPLLNEVRVATDYILRAPRCAALSLGRGMASTVVAQRHLWLTLSDVPDRDRAKCSACGQNEPGQGGDAVPCRHTGGRQRPADGAAGQLAGCSLPSVARLRPLSVGAANRCHGLQFRVKPPRFQGVVNTTVNTEAAMILREEIKALLQKRAIRVVPTSETNKGVICMVAVFRVSLHISHSRSLQGQLHIPHRQLPDWSEVHQEPILTVCSSAGGNFSDGSVHFRKPERCCSSVLMMKTGTRSVCCVALAGETLQRCQDKSSCQPPPRSPRGEEPQRAKSELSDGQFN
ncbi:uncharacterized protein LOC112843926 [Oreochromis niloticus]|uniref:uncharacterized protein LOC112843926 n=1 Tax=Oreochromis niloticus TaxID=8128 RepID=UPI000DF3B393|nr:uncharacterized protein LOC112843926 [Oreochromis niloticus]CAI5639325.1 unnamed protein product [Mustela putorius furo]